MQLAPASLNFGNQPVGTTSLPKTITFSNKGHMTVSITWDEERELVGREQRLALALTKAKAEADVTSVITGSAPASFSYSNYSFGAPRPGM